MFQITVTDNFSSAHSLRGYPGKCANTHGHNFDVKLTLNAHNLDELGMIIDFAIVKEKLCDALQTLDHKDLNSLPMFKDINPTSENIAKYIHDDLTKKLEASGVELSAVEVSENPSSSATYLKE